MKTVLKEWFISAPWGKIALISWGNANGDPILLVHGRQDSAATFNPLLELLPDTYHYVAVDLPGSGLSDPLPVSVMLTRIFPVIVVQMVADHMMWKQFTYIGHSMATEIGLFYNAIFSGRLKKCVYLDGGPAIQRLMMTSYSDFYKTFYQHYYDNYERINEERRVFSAEAARKAVMKARGLTREQADLILSRNMKKIGDDQYTLSWDSREKILAPTFFSADYYTGLFSLNVPPTLFIAASNSDSGYIKGKEHARSLISDLANQANFQVVTMEGGHDVHFTNPERVAASIISFLEIEESRVTKSKL